MKKPRKVPLHGEWALSFTDPITGEQRYVAATVPGNVEVDLMREGLVDDPYPPDDVRAIRQYDLVDDWTYRTEFSAPECTEEERAELVLEGVDTIAEVSLNGEEVLRCENMFIPHSVDVTDRLRPHGNELLVRIRSPLLHARRFPYPACQVSREYRRSQAYLRKARHMWGWDNAPRLLSAGLWRPVHLRVLPPVWFGDIYVYTENVGQEAVSIGCNWSIHTPAEDLSDYRGRMELRRDGRLEHAFDFDVDFTVGRISCNLPRSEVRLWWPRGYGEPNLYDLCLTLYVADQPTAEWSRRFGIRRIELIRSEVTNAEGEGEFLFRCNGESIYVRGTNWKPKDALHSRAASRVRDALGLCVDLHCNMVRVWGGGIYEDHEFFDFCDEHGLLVWQDFMFACEFPPRDEFFLQAVAREAEAVVKRLRNHPSLAIWCGDNEVDATFFWGTLIPNGLVPSDNRVNRQVLPDAVKSHDPYRPYVPSSPHKADCLVTERYLPPAERSGLSSPEEHLYPGNERFREAYRHSAAHFIGETGPFFINAMSQTTQIVERDLARARRLWDAPVNPADYTLDRHQTDEHFLTWKDAVRKRLNHFFGRDFALEPWQELAEAINIVCADMFKFAIEHSRCRRWRKTGVLWWSLMDMWPMMFNYSVVDYAWQPKQPAYDWIRRSQQPVCLMVHDTTGSGARRLFAANDTLKAMHGPYRIVAVDAEGREEEVLSGEFSVEPNCTLALQDLKPPAKPTLWLLEWQTGGAALRNHYVWGEPPHRLDVYRRWCARLNRWQAANR